MNREMRVIERFDGYNFLFYFIAGIKILTFFAFRFKKWKETLGGYVCNGNISKWEALFESETLPAESDNAIEFSSKLSQIYNVI